jgi:ribosomal protein S18 acetylase RimI-like enzyme
MSESIRLLAAADAADLMALRQRALHDHPEAFGSSPEEEQALTAAQFSKHFLAPPDRITIGAFQNQQLIGIVTLMRFPNAKTRHKVMLTGMYVLPTARGGGVGRRLITAAIGYARTLDGLTDLSLAVTVGNPAARTLYVQMGFEAFGIEPNYIRVDNRAYAIECMRLYL